MFVALVALLGVSSPALADTNPCVSFVPSVVDLKKVHAELKAQEVTPPSRVTVTMQLAFDTWTSVMTGTEAFQAVSGIARTPWGTLESPSLAGMPKELSLPDDLTKAVEDIYAKTDDAKVPVPQRVEHGGIYYVVAGAPPAWKEGKEGVHRKWPHANATIDSVPGEPEVLSIAHAHHLGRDRGWEDGVERDVVHPPSDSGVFWATYDFSGSQIMRNQDGVYLFAASQQTLDKNANETQAHHDARWAAFALERRQLILEVLVTGARHPQEAIFHDAAVRLADAHGIAVFHGKPPVKQASGAYGEVVLERVTPDQLPELKKLPAPQGR